MWALTQKWCFFFESWYFTPDISETLSCHLLLFVSNNFFSFFFFFLCLHKGFAFAQSKQTAEPPDQPKLKPEQRTRSDGVFEYYKQEVNQKQRFGFSSDYEWYN